MLYVAPVYYVEWLFKAAIAGSVCLAAAAGIMLAIIWAPPANSNISDAPQIDASAAQQTNTDTSVEPNTRDQAPTESGQVLQGATPINQSPEIDRTLQNLNGEQQLQPNAGSP